MKKMAQLITTLAVLALLTACAVPDLPGPIGIPGL